MAEFVGRRPPEVGDITGFPPAPHGDPQGFDAMGHPVPMRRRAVAYEQLKEIGVRDPAVRWTTVNRMSEHLMRDQPYRALEEATRVVDLTGAYRIMAFLLTG